VDVNKVDKDGISPVWRAAHHNKAEALRWVLASGREVCSSLFFIFSFFHFFIFSFFYFIFVLFSFHFHFHFHSSFFVLLSSFWILVPSCSFLNVRLT